LNIGCKKVPQDARQSDLQDVDVSMEDIEQSYEDCISDS
jgi:hypothetical protein